MTKSRYAISEEQHQLLCDARRHAGMMLGLAAAVTGAASTDDARVELRAAELSAVFGFLEDCIREVVESGEWIERQALKEVA